VTLRQAVLTLAATAAMTFVLVLMFCWTLSLIFPRSLP
jgi:hypothetical protein